MKMTSIALGALMVLLASCGHSPEQTTVRSEAMQGDYFFDFDALIHYTIDIDEGVLIEMEDDTNLSQKEQLQLDLILFEQPESVTDTAFISELESMGFQKKHVDTSQFERINEIFREKEVDESIFYACAAVYRDILVFKKNTKIIGLAKICFSCDQHRIHGTTANTADFGQDGDYGKLKRLLNAP